MIDREELYKLFKELPSKERCLYTDTFATCCFLHKQGEAAAAIKLLRDLLKNIIEMHGDIHPEFINKIVETIPDNERDYALAVPLRVEFRNLFTR